MQEEKTITQMDADGAAIPAIAESYDLSEDGKTYTFHLRDAKWSNGTPVTADDFVFAWRRICKEAGEYAYMFDSSVGCVKGADAIIYEGADPATLGVSAPDPKTLVVELEVPVSFFPSLMYFPTFYPINEAFYTSLEEGTYGTSPETFLSNGAFVLESYTPGTANLTVKKNPDYWDADRVQLAGISYQVVGSSDNALTAFKTGSLDVVTINLQPMTKAERLDKMQNDNYDIALTRWGPDYADPMTYLGMWIANNSNNYGFWSNAEYDQLITDCTTGAYISDYDARWEAMFKAETLVMQEAVIAPLYTKANANLITAGVEGIEFHPVALNRVYKNAVIK